jgi:hypothetical protein
MYPDVEGEARCPGLPGEFSLGSTPYAVLEGGPPFGSGPNSIALLHKVATASVPPPARAGGLTPLLLDMLSPEPDARPTMDAVAGRLAEVRTSRNRSNEAVHLTDRSRRASTFAESHLCSGGVRNIPLVGNALRP